jgi:hypothetical protein
MKAVPQGICRHAFRLSIIIRHSVRMTTPTGSDGCTTTEAVQGLSGAIFAHGRGRWYSDQTSQVQSRRQPNEQALHNEGAAMKKTIEEKKECAKIIARAWVHEAKGNADIT